MEPITLREILEATGGTLLGPVQDLEIAVQSVDTDSRAMTQGALFVPLVGDRFDGHAYIGKALESGAAGTLTGHELGDYSDDKFYVLVPDTMLALGDLAAYYRSKFQIKVIAVTGSVGKTTTKDMVASVLGERFQVLKTEGNFNNNIGVPKTLFGLEQKHQVAVIEMGMNHVGEIDYLTRIVRPDAAIITNIGDAHIENLGSRENTLRAKAEVFHGMTGKGLAVLNGDDPLLRTLEGALAQKTVWYGEGEKCTFRCKSLDESRGSCLHGGYQPAGGLEPEDSRVWPLYDLPGAGGRRHRPMAGHVAGGDFRRRSPLCQLQNADGYYPLQRRRDRPQRHLQRQSPVHAGGGRGVVKIQRRV